MVTSCFTVTIVQRYVEAQCAIAANDYRVFPLIISCAGRWFFPNNVHILLEIAKVEAIIGKNDEAIMNFEKNIDSARPEVYVALSVLAERKDVREALSFADKSIRVDERHIPGYILKGNLLLSTKRPELAVVAFRVAQELRPDLPSYQGAKKFYESALRLEPGYLGAALALAELHVIEGRNGDAVSLS
ncbi:hypothetical protein Tsubulata_045070 [Turnera subulata]|uniref:Uncharacterized protein n=1 Tax=Turnera subulata TaxID=218843 RepID=A0A9Q0FCW3_9ROSI|nr:hypothetical protein Tsubulata_045070 [Turnera subulata]